MPRGIPKARSDETAMRYTSFNVPLGMNPKHTGGSYLKNEMNNHWARQSRRQGKALTEVSAMERAQQTIVIHPGSSSIRVGRATDLSPLAIPSIVLRKKRRDNNEQPVTGGIETQTYVPGISRPETGSPVATTEEGTDEDEYHVNEAASQDPFEHKVANILRSLRERMRFYKLRITPNARGLSSSFNADVVPEAAHETDDREFVRVREQLKSKDVLVGEELDDEYVLRRPIAYRNFNSRDYPTGSPQLLLADIEAMIEHAVIERLEVDRKQIGEWSAILVVPEFLDRTWVKEWCQILLRGLGFGRVCVQQESLAATYGAGITSACVVDIGATMTSIAVVDDGLVIPDTRIQLLAGGNDVTEFLFVLLQRVGFPYKDANLARTYDWAMLEQLKRSMCSLNEMDVGLNVYSFAVRTPGRPAQKYQLKAYDESILAPMVMFEPRVIDFDRKELRSSAFLSRGVEEDIQEIPGERMSAAIAISTDHLLRMQEMAPAVPILQEVPDVEVATGTDVMDLDTKADLLATPQLETPLATPSGELPPTPAAIEIAPPLVSPSLRYDAAYEAAKLPLDVAIFNSMRGAGGDDRVRKYLQAILVVGGGSHVPGMNHALESRLQAIGMQLVMNMEKVTILAPPRDVDAADLAWRGGAVLAKMEGVNDLWVTGEDWDLFGMRSMRERCFYL